MQCILECSKLHKLLDLKKTLCKDMPNIYISSLCIIRAVFFINRFHPNKLEGGGQYYPTPPCSFGSLILLSLYYCFIQKCFKFWKKKKKKLKVIAKNRFSVIKLKHIIFWKACHEITFHLLTLIFSNVWY